MNNLSNEVRWGENEANVERELKNIADEIEEEVKRVELVPGRVFFGHFG